METYFRNVRFQGSRHLKSPEKTRSVQFIVYRKTIYSYNFTNAPDNMPLKEILHVLLINRETYGRSY